ncbi:hypothetical protein AGMMS49546_04430 [Spirochaetia bacterium]|nr:hypothetical protein AGMMS49546_04430 [Spirochaetia bacterium]
MVSKGGSTAYTSKDAEIWDEVDNAIHDFLESLKPPGTEIPWDGLLIAKVRETLIDIYVNDLHLCIEEEFYP